MPKKATDLVPLAEICRVTGYTARRIQQFAAEGAVPRAANGKYQLAASIQGILRAVRSTRTVSTEARRLAVAKARAAELHAARLESALIDFEDVVAIQGEILGTFRQELGGVPAAATRDLTVRASIEAALNAALDRCGRRFDDAKADLRAGRDPLANRDDD